MTDRDQVTITAQALTSKVATLEKLGRTREPVSISQRMAKQIAGWLTELASRRELEEVETLRVLEEVRR